jgi:hypothetical protein
MRTLLHNKPILVLLLAFSFSKNISAQVDSVSLFYERYNTILTFALADYRSELKSALGEKAGNFSSCLDALVANEKGKKLFLREGFWNAPGCSDQSNLFQLEAIPLSLFKSGMARLTRKGILFTNEMVEVVDADFRCCGKKDGAVCGTAVFVKSKTAGNLMRAIKSFNEAAGNTTNCKPGFE